MFSAGGMGLIPGQRTKILYAMWCKIIIIIIIIMFLNCGTLYNGLTLSNKKEYILDKHSYMDKANALCQGKGARFKRLKTYLGGLMSFAELAQVWRLYLILSLVKGMVSLSFFQ